MPTALASPARNSFFRSSLLAGICREDEFARDCNHHHLGGGKEDSDSNCPGKACGFSPGFVQAGLRIPKRTPLKWLTK